LNKVYNKKRIEYIHNLLISARFKLLADKKYYFQYKKKKKRCSPEKDIVFKNFITSSDK